MKKIPKWIWGLVCGYVILLATMFPGIARVSGAAGGTKVSRRPTPTVIPTMIPTAIPTVTPTITPVPVGQTGNWKLIFEDNFNGTAVDFSKWWPSWFGKDSNGNPSDTALSTPINSKEISCYDPANLSVSNGELLLTAKVNTKPGCLSRNGTANYSSGLIMSYNHFSFTYGYVEARIWNPAGPDHTSFWPAFWTDGTGLNWPTTGEIDVMECYGTDSSCSYHYHYNAGNGADPAPGGSVTVPGSTTGYHVYAANWEPGKITWYFDGQMVGQQTAGVISVPHFLIVNLGLIGTQGTLPGTMKVDYVRVWQGVAPTVTP